MDALDLAKYEALGNDFLVLVDLDAEARLSPALVAALCDRHRGVGADGVLHLSQPAGATIAMALSNADGSAAETSGNGLRCAALAAVHAGLARDELVIETVAGPVRAVVHGVDGGRADVSVEMGVALVEPVDSPMPGRLAFRVDVGNPHLVFVGGDSEASLGDLDLARLGSMLETAVPGGQNVEFVAAGTNSGRIAIRIWERGVGITEACGSGSVASAAACRLAGLAGDHVTVANPGGELVVTLHGSDHRRPTTTLRGPARRVAEVRVAFEDLPAGLER